MLGGKLEGGDFVPRKLTGPGSPRKGTETGKVQRQERGTESDREESKERKKGKWLVG